jgi:hypothetical protein
MTVRPWAEFTSELPDDLIEDETGIVQYGGRSVAEAIVEILRGIGCEADPPIYAHDHGWEIEARCGKRRLRGQVTQVEGYIFNLEDPSWFSGRLARNRAIYLDVLSRLAEALARDARFHDVRWYVNDDVLSGKEGAARPVEA